MKQSRLMQVLFLFLLMIHVSMGQEKYYLRGQGSSMQSKFMDKLGQLFSQDSSHPWNLNYEVTNSFTSLQALNQQGNSVNVAVVDNFPNNDGGSSFSASGILCFPTTISSILIIVNIPDFPNETVRLSTKLLYLIFKGSITVWNDPLLVELNPWLSTVSISINRYYRTDNSGTSSAFSQMLSLNDASRSISFGYNISSNLDITTRPSFVAESNQQIYRYVSVNSYSIGYVSSSVISTDSSVRLAVINDKVWNPSQIQKSITQWGQSPIDTKTNLLASLHSFISTDGYPLNTVSYMCVQQKQTDVNNGIGILRLLFYIYATESTSMFDGINYFALPNSIRTAQSAAASSKLDCVGQSCLFYYNERFQRGQITVILVVVSIVVACAVGICCFFFCVGVLLPLYAYRARQSQKKMETQTTIKVPLLQHDLQDNAYENIMQQHQIVGDEDLGLDELIGSGSFAQVYKGRWLGVVVAIKKMKISDFEPPSQTNSSDNSTSLEDFIKETKLMAQLKHPNCLQFLGTSVKSPFVYLITEYCSRGSVQSIIRNKSIKLSLRKSVGMMLDAARGMFYLHSHNPPIIHRDFKSANLLVNENWSVKVADFGMSTTLKKGKEQTICGTPETAAPEVLARSSYTEKADVYSFGIVLWEVLTREILYPGLNFYELSVRVVNEGLRPSLSDYDFPTQLRNLMKQTWSGEPSERPGFAEIVRVLEEFHSQLVQQQQQKSNVL